MAKEKKISVKYFVNTKLKPRKINGFDCFPVYVMIGYNKNSYKFKLKIDGNRDIYVKNEEGLSKMKYLKLEDKLANREKMIKKIIRYEEGRNPFFSLVNFSKKLAIYDLDIGDFLKNGINYFLDEVAKSTLSYKDFLKYSKIENVHDKIIKMQPFLSIEDEFHRNVIGFALFHSRFYIYTSIIKEKKITIYDWLFNGFRNKVNNFFNQYEEVKNSQSEIKKLMSHYMKNELPPEYATGKSSKNSMVNTFDKFIFEVIDNSDLMKYLKEKG